MFTVGLGKSSCEVFFLLLTLEGLGGSLEGMDNIAIKLASELSAGDVLVGDAGGTTAVIEVSAKLGVGMVIVLTEFGDLYLDTDRVVNVEC